MPELTGVTIGITAERRAEEFSAALRRRGATVWHAPTIRIVPLSGDDQLRHATEQVLEASVDLVAVTTGAGFRGWVDAAASWGLADPLLAGLAEARLFTRGPKATGAVRSHGLTEEWSSPGESNAELFAQLVDVGVAGHRVAVQAHGSPMPEHTERLRAAGAHVLEIQPYRWQWPIDLVAVRQLVEGVLAGRVHALAFTSAPAAANLLTLAERENMLDGLLRALRANVLCACVGPVTAAPLAALDIPTVQPQRQRLGALVKLLADELGGSADR